MDGTPIVDIKPYIKQYDSPESIVSETSEQNSKENYETKVKEPSIEPKDESLPNGWIEGSVVCDICVEFSTKSLEQLKKFHELKIEDQCDYCLKHLKDFEESKNAIKNLLKADPRSVYRRTKCVDRLYYFTIDSIHITSWFDIETNVVEVIKIKPFIRK